MKQIGASTTNDRVVRSAQFFGLSQHVRPVNRLMGYNRLFLQVLVHLPELGFSLIRADNVLKHCQPDRVTNLQAMPGSERQRTTVSLHKGGGRRRTFLFQVKRNYETGVRVGFQNSLRPLSRIFLIVRSEMTFSPKTRSRRASISGICRFFDRFFGQGMRRATASPASSHPRMRGKSCRKSLTDAVFM